MEKGKFLFCLRVGLIFVLSLIGFGETRAEENEIKGEFLIRFKPDLVSSSDIKSFIQKRGVKARVVKDYRIIRGLKLLKFREGNIQELKKLFKGRVDYIEPVKKVRSYPVKKGRSLSASSIFPNQWGLENGDNLDVDIERAWNVTEGDPEIVVGVIDSGVDYNHPDLIGNIYENPNEIPNNRLDDDGNGFIDDVRGWDFFENDNDPMDTNAHGTHCAGIIAGLGKNMYGVSPKVKILPLRFLDGEGFGTTADAISAIEYSIKMNVKILNNSWGGGGRSQALEEAIVKAKQKGVLFVVAAGNSGQDLSSWDEYPAKYKEDNIITVANFNKRGSLDFSSNFGKEVHIAAPGTDIYSTVLNGGYEFFTGTSMAAPFVSGVAALIFSRNPDLNYQQVRAILFKSSRKISSLRDKVFGSRFLNAGNALEFDDIPDRPVDPPHPVPEEGLAIKIDNYKTSRKKIYFKVALDLPKEKMKTIKKVIYEYPYKAKIKRKKSSKLSKNFRVKIKTRNFSGKIKVLAITENRDVLEKEFYYSY